MYLVELKLVLVSITRIQEVVLIVPSGIETRPTGRNRVSSSSVLIVPSGIETLEAQKILIRRSVLIVPSGIETQTSYLCAS